MRSHITPLLGLAGLWHGALGGWRSGVRRSRAAAAIVRVDPCRQRSWEWEALIACFASASGPLARALHTLRRAAHRSANRPRANARGVRRDDGEGISGGAAGAAGGWH